eukprot:TRINITY_DN3776_c0_g2_i1.p1 TRINITY_DN3776_c0_g2~~TRINITY_DN3776_c0_g2_i1.p1  ORF type:complete len:472 (+),score=115.19 TRINITY_DN3776_c0_g2_i1:68-1483(+)
MNVLLRFRSAGDPVRKSGLRFYQQARPANVGILAMETYIPHTFVNQTALENFDGVSPGKYTVGLGQENMSFVSPREDVTSICMTAVQSLLEKYRIRPDQIGRIEVGTESRSDKSKALKTDLLRLFPNNAHDSEGVDTTNACYGGTAALFNCGAWIESSFWDGRYALMVCGDVAVYEPGPARPSGGVGAVAMLIGPDAPLSLEPGLRTTYMEHAYDFWKPDSSVETPLVDGKLSISCYLRALDFCYGRFADKATQKDGMAFSTESTPFALFHAPFNKMVQKSFARMLWNDFRRQPSAPLFASVDRSLLTISVEESYTSKEIDSTFAKLSAELYKTKVAPSTLLPRQLGNSYTPSLYYGLASLIAERDLNDKRLAMFSYGSGLSASLFSVRGRRTATGEFSLERIRDTLDVRNRLAQRLEQTPDEFTMALRQRAEVYGKRDFKLDMFPTDKITPGTYILDAVDNQWRTTYCRL